MSRSNVVRINAFANIADNFESAVKAFIDCCKGKNISPNTQQYYFYRLQSAKQTKGRKRLR